jgi:hypothetical protein
MSLIDIVQQSLGQQEVQQISQQIGADPATTQAAIQNALPLILGGMAGTAQQAGGASGIESLLGSHSGVLGNLGSILGGALGGGGGGGGAGGGLGGGILDTILGGHHADVQQGVQTSTGLSSEATKKLLVMLAPIVLGALARHRSQGAAAGQAAQGGIGDVLAQEAQQAGQNASPHVGGILGKILGGLQG